MRGFDKAKSVSAVRRRAVLLIADVRYSIKVLRFSTILVKKYCLERAVNI